ncbi:unnamed protein product, partial [Allacma fusca]
SCVQPPRPSQNVLSSDMTESKFNSTVESRLNISMFYNISFIRSGEAYWVDLESHSKTLVYNVWGYPYNNKRYMELKFNFTFYGHLNEFVRISTSGLINLGDKFITGSSMKSSYMAPLRVNFTSYLSANSKMKYLSTSEQLTWEWNLGEVRMTSDKFFTFQTTLYKNGTFVFAYKNIPFSVLEATIGLSDAFTCEHNMSRPGMKHYTKHNYGQVDLHSVKNYIGNGTAIVFQPLPTCLTYKSCHECSRHETSFDCVWCISAGRCSDGTDRNRQDWITKGCLVDNVTLADQCDSVTPYKTDRNMGTTGRGEDSFFKTNNSFYAPTTAPMITSRTEDMTEEVSTNQTTIQPTEHSENPGTTYRPGLASSSVQLMIRT